jgi:hypothetical protein
MLYVPLRNATTCTGIALSMRLMSEGHDWSPLHGSVCSDGVDVADATFAHNLLFPKCTSTYS